MYRELMYYPSEEEDNYFTWLSEEEDIEEEEEGDNIFTKLSAKNMRQDVRDNQMTKKQYSDNIRILRNAELRSVDDESTCTKNVIPFIHYASRETPNVDFTILCTTVDHYASSYGDRGWGCGYRNFQMLLSSLIHDITYANQLELWYVNTRDMPSVTRIQEIIEWAWQLGFDKEGHKQMNGSVINTTKWIGTSEIASMLGSIYLRCHIQDFVIEGGYHFKLFNWVCDYFHCRGHYKPPYDHFKPPLYLQGRDHSRTIVGIEKISRYSCNLLVLDPSHRPEEMAQLFNTATAQNVMQLIRKSVEDLQEDFYQVLTVKGIMTLAEYEISKALLDVRRLHSEHSTSYYTQNFCELCENSYKY